MSKNKLSKMQILKEFITNFQQLEVFYILIKAGVAPLSYI